MEQETFTETLSGKLQQQQVIQIAHLQKAFGEQQVLKDLNLTLSKQENLVILGKSGTGKSVLIKCIVGLIFPDAGEINVMGKKVAKLSYKELNELRKRIGFLFQSAALYDSMSVRENLEFPLRRIKKELTSSQCTEKVEEVLENVKLSDAIDKMPSQLSGGMKKRVGLARTLIADPEIMLYDEPTTGLDPVTSHEINLLINEVQKKYKTSSIIITHDIACARVTSDRVGMLRDGKVYVEGKLEELEKSDDEWISTFFIENKK